MPNFNIPGWIWAVAIAALTAAAQELENIDEIWAPVAVAALFAVVKGIQEWRLARRDIPELVFQREPNHWIRWLVG